MTTFRYPLPEAEPPSPWGGLSDEARTALTRLAMGPSLANQLLTPEGKVLEGLSAEVQGWAGAELNNVSSYFDTWQNYDGQLGVSKSISVGELAANNPNLASKLTRLYKAKQSLLASGENTPEGTNVGETMHLALIPWHEMRNHLADFDQWVKQLRDSQGIARGNHIDEHLLAAIKGSTPFYRDSDTPSQLLTASQYLDKKIAEDGPVGVMLVQTSSAAGIERLVGQTPNQMTSDGSQHLEVAGSNVDSMGVFEWIALTMQKDPRELSRQDYSWLLANRMTIQGVTRVLYVGWHDGRVMSNWGYGFRTDPQMRVCLAVM